MKKCPVKFFLSLALSIAMLMTGILWPALAEEPLAIVEAKAIAETLPEGQTVTGVRIEYPGLRGDGIHLHLRSQRLQRHWRIHQ